MSLPPSQILALLQNAPDAEPIDLDTIRSLCSANFAKSAWEDRAIAWLLLSHVLPNVPCQLSSALDCHLSSYMRFATDFGVIDYHLGSPLSLKDGLEFGVPQEKLMFFIHGDVARTTHHAIFFPQSDDISADSGLLGDLAPFKTHLRRVERVLYIFASVNPSIGYLQGFHELCCVLYYVFSRAVSWFGDDMMKVEAIVFCCFQQLMGSTRLQELFQTDDESSLIHHRLGEFMELLAWHLPKVAATLAAFEVHPLAFAFKWLNLLFAQDHLLPDLLILWDALFAHFDRLVGYAMYIGIAHVKMIEEKIKPHNYFETIEALQNPQIKNVQGILNWTKKFWESDEQKSKKGLKKRRGLFRRKRTI